MNPFHRIRLMIARAVVNLVNDAGGLQLLQVNVLHGETRDEVERVQNFGQTSHPPAGSIPILAAVGGSRDHMVAVAVDSPEFRPKGLKQGESATYNAHGVLFYFDDQGNATLNCKNFIINASEGIQATTPLATFSHAVTVNGLFSYKAGMSGQGGGQLAGQFSHSGGGFSSNGIQLDSHRHRDVTEGDQQSGGPV